MAALIVVHQCKELWEQAIVTEICSSQQSKDSIIAMARLHSTGSLDSYEAARTAYYQFLQHITMLPIGATGLLLGIITKRKLIRLGSSAMSAVPLLLGVRRFLTERDS